MRQILKNQSGMASIMFAIFMAIVLCLLAVGFATLVRNDQRQTLDKTLSNQATYAAESAINKIQINKQCWQITKIVLEILRQRTFQNIRQVCKMLYHNQIYP